MSKCISKISTSGIAIISMLHVYSWQHCMINFFSVTAGLLVVQLANVFSFQIFIAAISRSLSSINVIVLRYFCYFYYCLCVISVKRWKRLTLTKVLMISIFWFQFKNSPVRKWWVVVICVFIYNGSSNAVMLLCRMLVTVISSWQKVTVWHASVIIIRSSSGGMILRYYPG